MRSIPAWCEAAAIDMADGGNAESAGSRERRHGYRRSAQLARRFNYRLRVGFHFNQK